MSCVELDLRGGCLELTARYDTDLSFSVKIVDINETTGVKTVRDITGYTIQLQIRETKGGANILTDTASILVGTDGVADFFISSTDISSNLVVDKEYYFNIVMTDLTPVTTGIYYGNLTFTNV